jgi:aryl-alcohol dehydrogenase-like predicted oxidoreductase
MNKLHISGTDLQVSPICLGAGPFGTVVKQADAFAMLDTFVDLGGNFVDTARVYADWIPGGQNASEKTIGAWLGKSGLRDQIVLATKGAHPDLKTMHISRLSPQDIATDIAASLRYLQVVTIDLYWLHRDDLTLPVGEIVDALHEQVQAGRIRYFGCSNWTVPRLQAANDYAQAYGVGGFVANQPMWSMAVPNADAIGDKTLVIMGDSDHAFHRDTGMAVVPYTAQAKGYFTKLAENRLKDSDSRAYDNPTNRVRFERAQELAVQHSVTVTAIVLSYLTSQPFPVVPIVGPRSLAQLRDCVQHIDLKLSADELAYLSGSIFLNTR